MYPGKLYNNIFQSFMLYINKLEPSIEGTRTRITYEVFELKLRKIRMYIIVPAIKTIVRK